MGKLISWTSTISSIPLLTIVPGPGTDWYRDNIQRFDPYHPSNANNPLMKRQDSVTFNPEMTQPTTLYGTANPVDVVNSLYDGCAQSSCNNGPFYYTATYVTDLGEVTTGTGSETAQRTLQLDPIGSWDGSDPNHRSYYIESLRQIMSSNIQSKDQDWINGGSSGEFCALHFLLQHAMLTSWLGIGGAIQQGTETIWTGAQYVNMNRFTNGGMNGQLSVKITVVPENNGDCGAITGAISAVTGVISGIGGGFFGLLGSIIC